MGIFRSAHTLEALNDLPKNYMVAGKSGFPQREVPFPNYSFNFNSYQKTCRTFLYTFEY